MPLPRRTDGFTLIELLVVIALIGLIATVATVAINGARMKSRDNKRVADLKQVQKAIELSYSATTGYPTVAAPIQIGAATTDVICGKGATSGFVADTTPANCDADKIYMGLVPTNPTPGGTNYTYESTNGTGGVCTSGVCAGFCLQMSLEGGLPAAGLVAGNVLADQTALKNGSCP
jgi:prepilin-type N-terminal cleavage/methylation domain-containing protein